MGKVAERGTNFSIAKQLRSTKKWRNHVAVSLRMRPYTSTNQIILQISKDFLDDPTTALKTCRVSESGDLTVVQETQGLSFLVYGPISHPKKHRKVRGNVLNGLRETMCVFPDKRRKKRI